MSDSESLFNNPVVDKAELAKLREENARLRDRVSSLTADVNGLEITTNRLRVESTSLRRVISGVLAGIEGGEDEMPLSARQRLRFVYDTLKEAMK